MDVCFYLNADDRNDDKIRFKKAVALIMCLVGYYRRTGSTSEAGGYTGFLREKKQKKSLKAHGQKKARGEDSENIPQFTSEDIAQASQALQDKAMVCSM